MFLISYLALREKLPHPGSDVEATIRTKELLSEIRRGMDRVGRSKPRW
jgi:hypothetical protein